MRKFFESLWGAVQVAVHLMFWPLLWRQRRRWGASEEEIRRRLPGDKFVPQPDWSYNHAVTIHAPRSAVWPWLLQLGQGRAGFYSYEGLENLIGCRIRNVTEIRPELQTLSVGDVVRTLPTGFGPQVVLLDPERALVLGGPPNAKGSQATWAFYLLDAPDGTTRLLERGRNVVGKGLLEKLGFGPYLIDPIGFVMNRKMLWTIKHLAEDYAPRASAGTTTPASV
jgi:hypothetical protein